MRKLRKVEWVVETLDLSSVQAAYRLARLGLIPSVRLGRQLRFDEEAIHEHIRKGGSLPPREDAPRPAA